jgi:hypothetical protein
MNVIAGDPHRIFIRPTAQHARKRRLRTGEVHEYWRTGGCADSVNPMRSIRRRHARKRCRQIDHPSRRVDGGGLQRGDLVLAEGGSCVRCRAR